MKYAEKQRIEKTHWGTHPNASWGQIRSVETLRALEDVLNADPQGDIHAKLTPQEDGSLRFLIKRLNPLFTLESDVVHVEWHMPLKQKPGGLYEVRILEGSMDEKLSSTADLKINFREVTENRSLDFHVFEMLYAAHEMLTDLGRQRLGRAIPAMLEQSSMAHAQKQFFARLAAEYFSPLSDKTPEVAAPVSIPDYALS